ncbi:MAG: four helix bundle protein [Bacteroidales bacterium]|nr:four helix bundle protein [Bacteroidales bacterium]
MERITTHRQLNVYKRAYEAARSIYRLTKSFPKEETYSLTDQIYPVK